MKRGKAREGQQEEEKLRELEIVTEVPNITIAVFCREVRSGRVR